MPPADPRADTGAPVAEHVLAEQRGPVLVLTLNRPDRLNALTPLMAEQLMAAFDRADADDSVRVVVITGSGRGFCAGADLGSGPDRFNYDDPANHRDLGGIASLRIFEALKPVIAAFNGPAVGAGITMMLAADIRLASTTAKFGFVFARRGIVLESASSWFLPRLVGISRAMEWASTGRVFGADEALEAGLVRSVHEPGALLPAALDLAEEIAANTAPVSVALNRQMLWRMLGADHPMAAHELDSRAMGSRGRSADAREGISAFLEKRAAAFPDRVSADLPEFYPWWPERPFTPLGAIRAL
ncbi:MAG: enoyl-CoA hydratase [Nocardia sp.]|uniref:enoyl-CoA hydratase-related protein n=1 Tax=Nocardia sp. TaxID=1821 RepID=UPI002621CE42|nr:enoyl-CoA hydratase-related protein [Nocardia sp.]MCU1644393.1 enoyl-CoA hydratase [Nocardia sp.]